MSVSRLCMALSILAFAASACGGVEIMSDGKPPSAFQTWEIARLGETYPDSTPVERDNIRKTLLLALEAEKPLVRAAAVRALARAVGSGAETNLIGLVSDNSALVRHAAIQEIRAFATTGSLHPLLDTLENESDPSVKMETVKTLGKIADMKAVPALIKLLDDPDSGVRFLAEKALIEITGVRQGHERIKWRSWWDKRAKTPEPNVPEKNAHE